MSKEKRRVPKLRFPGFTEDWEQRKADYIFKSVTDKGYPELPVLSASQELGMVYRDQNGIDIQHDKKNETSYKRVLPGQFVIHLRSFQGGFAYSEIEGITSPAYTVMSFKNSSEQYGLFWKHVFKSETFIKRLETITYGIRDGRSISFSDFKSLLLQYPSFSEQKLIGDSIAVIERGITLHQRKLDNLKLKKKALLQKLFPKNGERYPELRFPGFTDAWEQRKLGEYANFRRGSFPQPYGNKEWYDGVGSAPFVQVVDVGDNLSLVECTKQRISKLAQPMSVYAEKGSVLVTLQGSIGRVAVSQYDAFIDRTILIFQGYKYKTNSYFWAYIIKNKFFEEALKAPGGTIKTITKEVLSNFIILYPKFSEQEQIGSFFEKLDKLITLHQRKLDHLQLQKKALLQQMFV